MSSKIGALLAIALFAAAIVLALTLAFRSWTPRPETTEIAIYGAADLNTPAPTGQLPKFAAAEIELSLADLCAIDDEDATTETQSHEETLAQIEEYKDSLRNVKERLVVSSEAEHLHLAALLETNPAARVDLVTRALSMNREDAFLVWDAVQICAAALDQTNCPIGAWEDQLLAIDGQNSESWVRVATNRYLAGNVEAAFRAMQRAASSAETRAYWTESIEMIERGLAAGSDYSFSERAAAAFAVSKLSDYGAYSNMCKVRSAKSIDWAYVCLAYGELVERQGKTDMGQSIARSIQVRALESSGNEERRAAVVERHELNRQIRVDSSNAYSSLTEKLLLSDPVIFSGYLAAVRTHGEVSAKAYLQKETDRWLSRHEGIDCAP